MKIKLSIVLPVWNEEKIIPELYRRLKTVLNKTNKLYEIIFINDGSTDQSLLLLKKLQKKDKKIKIISFSRNFGHMPAVMAGLKHASGEKVVVMDSDLQDPPECIPKMCVLSLQGFDVVYGTKKKRKEGVFRKILFASFYKILNKISQHEMPFDAGTFSLLNRKVVEILTSLSERNKYFSGLRAWTGFSQTSLVYEREARFAGKSASFRRLFKLAADGLISFSYIPLRLASFLGFIFASLAFIFIILVIILRLMFGFGIIGWASTLITILLLGGIQLITLGIIGEYLARIYDEVKNRPEYIISEKYGFDKK